MCHYKNSIKYILFIITLNFSVAAQAYTEGVKITGTKTVTLHTNNTFSPTQKITLNTITIDNKLKKEIKALVKDMVFQTNSQFIAPYEFNAELGMNGVPVYNQGDYGTCAIFTVTALLNALEYNSDFISQQCLLELGEHLYKFKAEDSGWEGALESEIFDRVIKYGIVDKSQCPRLYPNNKVKMSPQVYGSLSQPLPKKIAAEYHSKNNLETIKQALNAKKRVIFGILTHDDYLDGLPINFSKDGLWAFPEQQSKRDKIIKDILTDSEKISAHSVIVTGYSDAKNYLKVRNSWGTDVGEFGEFYMSYDYARIMGLDVTLVDEPANSSKDN